MNEDLNEVQPIKQIEMPVKKNKKLLFATLGVALVLLVATGSYFLLAYLNKDTSSEDAVAQDNTVQQEEAVATPDYAKEMVSKIEEALKAELNEKYPSMEIEADNNAPFYKQPGTNYFVSGGEIGKGLSVKPVANNGSTLDETASHAVTEVINKTIASDTSLQVTDLEWMTRYQNDKLTCAVMGGGDPVFVNCANISDYSGLVAELAPFAKAYYAIEANKQYEGTVSLSKPIINQRGEGYQNAIVNMGSAEAPMGGFAGLFYAKDNTWSFFRGTQSVMSCSEYSTLDIQKAFAGDKCYTADNIDSTVTVSL